MASLIVTGMKDLDRAMRALEPRLQKKHIKKACRAAAKKLVPKMVAKTPRWLGVMHRAYVVRATSRKIKAETGHIKQGTNSKTGFTYSFNVKRTVAEEFGAKVEISRDSLNKAGEKSPRFIPVGPKDYFYPAMVELGSGGNSGQKPMREAAKQSEKEVLAEFATELRKFVMTTKPNVLKT